MSGSDLESLQRAEPPRATWRRLAESLLGGLAAFSRSWVEPLKWLLATRIPVLAVMYVSQVLLFEERAGTPRPDNVLVEGFARWDTGWYFRLASQGYDNIKTSDGQADIAFWPLFPLLLRGAAAVFGTTNFAAVAFVLNHLLLAVSTWLLYHLAERRHGRDLAQLATVLFLTYPYGTYYSAAYSESTYLAFTLGAFYLADRQRWGPAAIVCGIGTAARGVAVTTALGIALMYLEKRRFKLREVRADALWLLLSGGGFLAYSFFLWRSFGDPRAYVISYTARGWGAEVTPSRLLETVRALWTPEVWPKGLVRFQDLSCLAAFAGVTLLTVTGARRRPMGETAFAVASLLVYAKMWPTSGRYVGTIFPVYTTLAGLVASRPALRSFVVTLFAAMLALFTSIMARGGWLSG